jgi:hypothetical protein
MTGWITDRWQLSASTGEETVDRGAVVHNRSVHRDGKHYTPPHEKEDLVLRDFRAHFLPSVPNESNTSSVTAAGPRLAGSARRCLTAAATPTPDR